MKETFVSYSGLGGWSHPIILCFRQLIDVSKSEFNESEKSWDRMGNCEMTEKIQFVVSDYCNITKGMVHKNWFHVVCQTIQLQIWSFLTHKTDNPSHPDTDR